MRTAKSLYPCRICGYKLPASFFSLDQRRPDSVSAVCLVCQIRQASGVEKGHRILGRVWAEDDRLATMTDEIWADRLKCELRKARRQARRDVLQEAQRARRTSRARQ
jgi:hypothetical protein